MYVLENRDRVEALRRHVQYTPLEDRGGGHRADMYVHLEEREGHWATCMFFWRIEDGTLSRHVCSSGGEKGYTEQIGMFLWSRGLQII